MPHLTSIFYIFTFLANKCLQNGSHCFTVSGEYKALTWLTAKIKYARLIWDEFRIKNYPPLQKNPIGVPKNPFPGV